MKLIGLLLLAIIGFGIWEMARHRWYLRQIPVRVHVNGSRGKSSVSRLIAAGLRAGGRRVVVKTTGSAAAVIHTDGRETPVVRRGGPNIREQLKVIREAAREGCDALVIECMAVRPDLQHTCEHQIVHATHGVITNVRPDHLEDMGPTLADVAKSLSGTVPRRSRSLPRRGRLRRLPRRRAAISARAAPWPRPTRSLPPRWRVPYVEFPENVGLALAVCAAVGVPRETGPGGHGRRAARRGRHDPLALRHPTGAVTFVNGFAANDPQSYVRIWDA